LAPGLFRVPAFFGLWFFVVCFVVSSGVRFLVLLLASPLRVNPICALRTRWPQRALHPLLWDRPRRAAPLCASGSSS